MSRYDFEYQSDEMSTPDDLAFALLAGGDVKRARKKFLKTYPRDVAIFDAAPEVYQQQQKRNTSEVATLH